MESLKLSKKKKKEFWLILQNMYVNLKLGTPTQFFFKFLCVSTCNVYSATGLKCFLLHSCGQALRNVSKLHKLYFVTTCGSKWLACFQNSSIFITLIKKKNNRIFVCTHLVQNVPIFSILI